MDYILHTAEEVWKAGSLHKEAMDAQLVTLLGSWVSLLLVKWLGHAWRERYGSIDKQLLQKAQDVLQKEGITSLTTLDSYAQTQGKSPMAAFFGMALKQLALAAVITTGISMANLFAGNTPKVEAQPPALREQVTETSPDISIGTPQKFKAPHKKRPQVDKNTEHNIQELMRESDDLKDVRQKGVV